MKFIKAHVWIRINELYEAEILKAEKAADEMEQRARERRARLEINDAGVLEAAPSAPGMGGELETGRCRVDQGAERDEQTND